MHITINFFKDFIKLNQYKNDAKSQGEKYVFSEKSGEIVCFLGSKVRGNSMFFRKSQGNSILRFRMNPDLTLRQLRTKFQLHRGI